MKSLLLIGCLLLTSFITSVSAQGLPLGVMKREYRVEATGNQVWVYYPSKFTGKSLPCILIASAGTRMFHGMDLGASDVPEHVQYISAGFAVVAYGLSGPLPAPPTEESVRNAVRTFIQAKGGVDDALAALKLAKARHGFIDLTHVYAVGHSSAANVALNLAQTTGVVKACVAYAPPADLEKRFGEPLIAKLDAGLPGFRKFIEESSPFPNAEKINCPVMIFNALDDSKVKPDTIAAYVERLEKAGKQVKHVEVPNGDHYDSMIRQGIPSGIEFIKSLEPSK